MIKKLFVYGTLMENFLNFDKYLVGKVLKRSYGRVKGTLFHSIDKGYPMMIEGNDFVYGELIEIVDWNNTIKDLDKLENYFGAGNIENEYERILIEVEILNTKVTEVAYIYKYCKTGNELDKAVYIHHGNWRIYKDQGNH